MELPGKSDLRTNIYVLLREYKRVTQSLTELTIQHSVLKTEIEFLKETLRIRNESDLNFLNSQKGLEATLIQKQDEAETLLIANTKLISEKKALIESYDLRIMKLTENYENELNNLKKFHENQIEYLHLENKNCKDMLSKEMQSVCDKHRMEIENLKMINLEMKESYNNDLISINEKNDKELEAAKKQYMELMRREREKVALSEATTYMELDELKTDLHRKQREYEEKLKQMDYSKTHDVSDYQSTKNELQIKIHENRELQEELNVANTRLQVLQSKLMEMDCKLRPNNFTTVPKSYRNFLETSSHKFNPLIAPNENLKEQMNKMTYVTPNSKYLSEPTKYIDLTVPSPSVTGNNVNVAHTNESKTSHHFPFPSPLPHDVPSTECTEVKYSQMDQEFARIFDIAAETPEPIQQSSIPKRDHSEPGQKKKTKRRKLINPNDFSDY